MFHVRLVVSRICARLIDGKSVEDDRVFLKQLLNGESSPQDFSSEHKIVIVCL